VKKRPKKTKGSNAKHDVRKGFREELVRKELKSLAVRVFSEKGARRKSLVKVNGR